MASEGTHFETTACKYTHDIEQVLNRGLVRGWKPRNARLDAHLIELLQKLMAALDEARFAARRAGTEEQHEDVAALAAILKDSCAAALRRETAAELLDTVDRMVIRLSDDDSVVARARFEAGKVPPHLEEPEVARAWLPVKLKHQADLQRRHWTRIRLKRRLMWRFAAGMTASVVAAAAAATWAGADLADAALAVSAGALGSAMSGLFKLRDEVNKARDIVAFAAIGSAQVAVGGAAGILVLFLVKLGLLGGDPSPEWAAIGALAFAAGFSEPFLLGTVRGVAQASAPKVTEERPDSARDAARPGEAGRAGSAK